MSLPDIAQLLAHLPVIATVGGVVFFAVFVLFALRHRRRSLSRLKAQHDLVLNRDAILVEAAVNRVSDSPSSSQHSVDYVRLIGSKLAQVVMERNKADLLAKRLGLVGLLAAAGSSFITGSGFFGGFAIGFSFTVTSVGAVCIAITNYMGVDDTASKLQVLAERIRLELMQYVGSSSEYAGLSPEQAYTLFSTEIDKYLGQDIERLTAQAASRKYANKQEPESSEEAAPAA